MKKSAIVVTILMLAAAAQAQSYKDISDKVLLKQFKLAKDDLDKKWSNAKFVSKPDAFILKTGIYAALAMDSATSLTPQGDQLLTESEAAFSKYREMDAPQFPLLTDLVYKDGPIYLYSALFNKAYKNYKDQKWEESFQQFKRLSDISELLASKSLLNSPLDTTVILLTGYTAENSNHKDEAGKYYGKLIDAKVGGAGNEFIYRFMVLNAFQKGDMANFDKYKALGKAMYPSSEYFDYDKTDFAVGLSESFDSKVKAMEEVIAKDPSNYKANVTLAQVIFDTLHPRDGVPPANAAELETKMINSLEKAATAKPDDEVIYLVLGDHFIDKADKVNEARAAFVEDMKKRTKPGTAPSKADIAKRDELDKQYGDTFDKAREPYEKAAALLKSKSSLTGSQKQQYRKVAGYLGDIYNFKKSQAKGDQAAIAKYTAEAKKWNDLYDTLR